MERWKKMYRYRDEKMARRIVDKIKEMDLKMNIMHVCGTHQDTIVKFGIEGMLKKVGINIIQGPGCPVCVTTPAEIETSIHLAMKGKVLCTYGDMAEVPVESGSIRKARAKGCDVRIVYSISDAVSIAERCKKDVVFMGVGFETTAPTTASAILHSPPENFYVMSCHRLVPPAVDALLSMGEVNLDGIIEPGHVSTIIGAKPYEPIGKKYRIPQVIAGFEPLDVLMAVYMLCRQRREGRSDVEIEYRRAVRYEGNTRAIEAMNKAFDICDVKWRGFPILAKSGLKLKKKYEDMDAEKVFREDIEEIEDKEFKEPRGCRCGEVLRGIITPYDCPLFGKKCTPTTPVGPCMVSYEGACNILYKYGSKF